MKTSDLQKYLQRIPAWPKEAQDELVRSMVEIEHRYSERYQLDDEERAALERSAEDVRKNRFATDDDVEAVFTRYHRA
jgi:restriction endonuclease Mrr